MLKSLTLKDFVIVSTLDVEFGAGFSVLTGETGAGKSILIDALQLALGARAESHSVREGAARAEITAAFDSPASLAPWLEEAGFERDETLLLRRIVDAQGKSRGFINGSAATASQLREVADHLVDIHGQHAWQGLTRPAAVRALLDDQAGVDTRPMAAAWARWRDAVQALASARTRQGELETERERLQWQIGELARLNPDAEEWPELNAEHQRLSHGQSLMEAAAQAAQWVGRRRRQRQQHRLPCHRRAGGGQQLRRRPGPGAGSPARRPGAAGRRRAHAAGLPLARRAGPGPAGNAGRAAFCLDGPGAPLPPPT